MTNFLNHYNLTWKEDSTMFLGSIENSFSTNLEPTWKPLVSVQAWLLHSHKIMPRTTISKTWNHHTATYYGMQISLSEVSMGISHVTLSTQQSREEELKLTCFQCREEHTSNSSFTNKSSILRILCVCSKF